jgi:hypothetical protein
MRGEPGGGAVDDADGAGVFLRRPDSGVAVADSEVAVAVAIKVAESQGPAETLRSSTAEVGLGPRLSPLRGQTVS